MKRTCLALSLAVLAACGSRSSPPPSESPAPAAPAPDAAPAIELAAEVCWSLDECRVACERNTAKACTRYAEFVTGGWGVADDAVAGALLVERACELGDLLACVYCEGGASPSCDRRELRLRIVEACDRSEPEACTLAGTLFGWGGQRYFERGCELAEAESCAKYANFVVGEDSHAAQRRAGELRAAGCERGVAKDCDALAFLHLFFSNQELEVRQQASDHLGLSLDAETGPRYGRRAIDLWEAGCRRGYPGACIEAARTVSGLQLVRPDVYDPERGRELFALACELGDAWSCEPPEPRAP